MIQYQNITLNMVFYWPQWVSECDTRIIAQTQVGLKQTKRVFSVHLGLFGVLSISRFHNWIQIHWPVFSNIFEVFIPITTAPINIVIEIDNK